MTCKDFQKKWGELLDAETGAAGRSSTDEAEALLLAHAADCPACRTIAAQYQTLRHAIRAWRCPPVPPGDLVRRVLSIPDDLTPGTARYTVRRARLFLHSHRDGLRLLSGLAATWLVCLLLATLWPRINRQREAERRPGPGPVVADDLHSHSIPAPALDRALAEATSATWDLARSASEPAARIGREVLDATASDGDRPELAGTEDGLASLTVSVPSLDPLGPDGDGASGVLRQVGDQMSAGVRPLSSTARHAFGFLLGSPPTLGGTGPGGSASTGARSG